MSARCDQELCAYWDGDGCPCRVFDIDAEERAAANKALHDFLGDAS